MTSSSSVRESDRPSPTAFSFAETTEQEILRATTRRFIQNRWPISRVRTLIEEVQETPLEYLETAGDLGWFSLLVDERHGGGSISALPILDALVIAVERGRELQPGPFVEQNVAASVLSRFGTAAQQKRWLPGIVAGTTRATWGLLDPAATCALAVGERSAILHAVSNSESTAMVQDAHVADLHVLSALVSDGAVHMLVPAGPHIQVDPKEGLDLTRRFGHVRVARRAETGIEWLDETDSQPTYSSRALDEALVMMLGESLGAMERLLDFTVEYAKSRIAFGRAIGSFQAIKHLLADLSLLLEASRGVVMAAAHEVARGEQNSGEAAAMAKVYVSDASIEIAQGCLQVHGGIGYTWEHDLHLYLRRLTSDAVRWGSATWHRSRICAIHGLEARL